MLRIVRGARALLHRRGTNSAYTRTVFHQFRYVRHQTCVLCADNEDIEQVLRLGSDLTYFVVDMINYAQCPSALRIEFRRVVLLANIRGKRVPFNTLLNFLKASGTASRRDSGKRGVFSLRLSK